MANRVRVADLEFSSQKDARAFFYDIRDKYWGSQEVIEQGDSFTRLKALYEDYCHATNFVDSKRPRVLISAFHRPN